MGILYRDIVIHISEGRDFFLDIIKLALVVNQLAVGPNHQRRTLGSGHRHRTFDAEHESLTFPATAGGRDSEKERRSCTAANRREKELDLENLLPTIGN